MTLEAPEQLSRITGVYHPCTVIKPLRTFKDNLYSNMEITLRLQQLSLCIDSPTALKNISHTGINSLSAGTVFLHHLWMFSTDNAHPPSLDLQTFKESP